MRNIKFRGQTIDTKKWVHGDIIHYDAGEVVILEQYYGIWDILEGGYGVIPESIGQFTGLKDNNGNDIYEGDIVELFGWGSQKNSDGFALIEWDNDINGWNFNISTYAEDRYDFIKAISNCIKVTTIHENPHLI